MQLMNESEKKVFKEFLANGKDLAIIGDSYAEAYKTYGDKQMSELEKYTKSIHERNIIRNFLDYANEHNYFLCCEEGEQQSPEFLMLDTIETEGLLDGYFGIDSDELDNERREIRKRSEENELQ